MSKLYMMVGIPGMGKSTFVKKTIEGKKNLKWVSRDVIRFSLVAEGEEYFSKEKEVFETFVKEIKDSLMAGMDVFADATHLNKASRAKLLKEVKQYAREVDAVVLHGNVNLALERNELRKGTRAYVPRSQMRRMATRLTMPSFVEGFTRIYVVDANTMKIVQQYVDR